MVDLVEVKDVPVHVAAPRERVTADRAGVGLALAHYRNLKRRVHVNKLFPGYLTSWEVVSEKSKTGDIGVYPRFSLTSKIQLPGD